MLCDRVSRWRLDVYPASRFASASKIPLRSFARRAEAALAAPRYQHPAAHPVAAEPGAGDLGALPAALVRIGARGLSHRADRRGLLRRLRRHRPGLAENTGGARAGADAAVAGFRGGAGLERAGVRGAGRAGGSRVSFPRWRGKAGMGAGGESCSVIRAPTLTLLRKRGRELQAQKTRPGPGFLLLHRYY
jgi:hypothetical protein